MYVDPEVKVCKRVIVCCVSGSNNIKSWVECPSKD
mgnify:CR=1 FL=1